MKFTIVAVAAAATALPTLAAPVLERSFFAGELVYDDYPGQHTDAGNGVNYAGEWTTLENQGTGLYNGTETYTNQPNAEVRFEVPDAQNKPNHITIWSTTKPDRGEANVYCGTSLVGTLNEYSAEPTTESQVVFDQDVTGDCELPKGSKYYFVVKNDRGAPFIALDKVNVTYTGI